LPGAACADKPNTNVLAAGRARGLASQSRASPTASVCVCCTPSRVCCAGLRPPLTGRCKPNAGVGLSDPKNWESSQRALSPRDLGKAAVVRLDAVTAPSGSVPARCQSSSVWFWSAYGSQTVHQRAAYGPHTGRMSTAFGSLLRRLWVTPSEAGASARLQGP
jgi:hypothetical protein